ncbi:MAG: hypothetical protein M3Q69_18450 [Acidobacteriota bacterium]|nr:hypothetical protein [Acidobacteriota bacterium]
MSRSHTAVLLAAFCFISATFPANAAARRRAVTAPSITPNPLYAQGGYADASSVAQGSPIAFRIATSVSPFSLDIINLATDAVVKTIPNLTSQARNCTGLSAQGCGWPVTTVFDVPANLPSGSYAARFPTSAGVRNIFFVVRSAIPAAQSQTLVVVSTNTYQAYNTFGNLNVYPSDSPSRSSAVSFDRPYHDNNGLGRFPRWDKPFADFMRANNFPFEVAADTDLEDPTLLPRYKLVIFVGHSEYWTASARANLEAYSAMGGHIAIFGGNTMWWQVRLENQNRVMRVYKDAASDPLNGVDNAHVTVNWYAEPVNRPENLITGSSFRNGGYVNRDKSVPLEQRVPYTVTEPASWVFEGLATQAGAQFGRAAAGGETDGVLFNCDGNGLAVAPDGSDATPLTFHILATVPAGSGYGVIGYYVNAQGAVTFNAGTQDWPIALASDPLVAGITRNVIRRLSNGVRFPLESPSRNDRMREHFNCAMPAAEVLPGWRGEEAALQLNASCAYEGPTGADLSGEKRIFIARNIAPTGNATSVLYSRFYMKADAASGTDVYGLYTLNVRSGTAVKRVARIDYDPKAKAVRAVQYNADTTTGNRSDWISLGSGWHSVQFGWRSPGAITIQVDDGNELTIQNPVSGQVVNEVQLFVPADPAKTNGHLCIDALAAALEKLPAVPGLR